VPTPSIIKIPWDVSWEACAPLMPSGPQIQAHHSLSQFSLYKYSTIVHQVGDISNSYTIQISLLSNFLLRSFFCSINHVGQVRQL